MTHVTDICSGQQDLRNGLVQLRKQIVPESDKATLSDSSQSLLTAQLLSAIPQSHVS